MKDSRGAEEFGNTLLEMRKQFPKLKLSEVADKLDTLVKIAGSANGSK